MDKGLSTRAVSLIVNPNVGIRLAMAVNVSATWGSLLLFRLVKFQPFSMAAESSAVPKNPFFLDHILNRIR